MNPAVSAEERFNQLDSNRYGHLERCRRCASLTLPWVLPPEGHSLTDQLPLPEQTMGARCVNNLASKLLLTLFPSNIPFVRLELGNMEDLMELENTPADETGQLTLKDLLDEAFSVIERQSVIEFSKMRLRKDIGKILMQLIITGNSLYYENRKTNRLRVYRLDNWVVRLSPEGEPIEIIVREATDWESLTEEQ